MQQEAITLDYSHNVQRLMFQLLKFNTHLSICYCYRHLAKKTSTSLVLHYWSVLKANGNFYCFS